MLADGVVALRPPPSRPSRRDGVVCVASGGLRCWLDRVRGGEDASRSSASGVQLGLLVWRGSSLLFKRPKRRPWEEGAGGVVASASGVCVPARDLRWWLDVGGALGSSSVEDEDEGGRLSAFLLSPPPSFVLCFGTSFTGLLDLFLGLLAASESDAVAVEPAVAGVPFDLADTLGEDCRGEDDASTAAVDDSGFALEPPNALVAFRRPKVPILVVVAFFFRGDSSSLSASSLALLA